MHRIDGPLAQPTLPAPTPAGVPGFFFRGNPRAGILATQVDDDWLNAVQEEIAHVIEFAGIDLDKTDYEQLRMAIEVLVKRGLPPTPFLPLAGGAMQGPIHQHIWPGLPSELANRAYVDHQDNEVVGHANRLHEAAVNHANVRAIQEGDRAQHNAYAWDQEIWGRVNWIDGTQGGFAAYGASGLFTVPGAARLIEPITSGGGAGGGGCHGPGYGGGGGGAGGTAIGAFAVMPGQQFWVTVGHGGQGGDPGGGSGQPGGASQFGDLLGASGGQGGGGSAVGGALAHGGEGGSGFGSGLGLRGGMGSDGVHVTEGSFYGRTGNGGASYWGGGARASIAGDVQGGRAPGSGGGGTYGQPGWGGSGAPGLVIVRWHR